MVASGGGTNLQIQLGRRKEGYEKRKCPRTRTVHEGRGSSEGAGAALWSDRLRPRGKEAIPHPPPPIKVHIYDVRFIMGI